MEAAGISDSREDAIAYISRLAMGHEHDPALIEVFVDTAPEALRYIDLDRDLAESPSAEWLTADSWRVHFHVPVDAESLGPLGTTRDDLRRALACVAGDLDYEPHLEVETYTWEVLPGSEQPDLVSGLTRELEATAQLLEEVSAG